MFIRVKGTDPYRSLQKVGPDLAFGRLWESAGIVRVLNELLGSRRFEFPVVDGMKQRFGLKRVCWVAGRGMEYVLGARMHRLKKRGWELGWHDIRQYLEALSEIEVSQGENSITYCAYPCRASPVRRFRLPERPFLL